MGYVPDFCAGTDSNYRKDGKFEVRIKTPLTIAAYYLSQSASHYQLAQENGDKEEMKSIIDEYARASMNGDSDASNTILWLPYCGPGWIDNPRLIKPELKAIAQKILQEAGKGWVLRGNDRYVYE